jgi:hypothetical protein
MQFNFYLFFILFSNFCLAQQPKQSYTPTDITNIQINNRDTLNKKFPSQYRNVILLTSLYYPELQGLHITFRIKKQRAPLSARPAFASIFKKPVNRKYLITISNHTLAKLKPIMLDSLSFNAQLGVMGHEMAHIADYNNRKTFYFIKLLLGHLSKKYIDAFEFENDARTIKHGLGYALLSWSKEVRLKLNLKQWGGAQSPEAPHERYMNPATILKLLNQMP